MPELWRAVDDLAERAPSVEDLRRHGLQLLAARRLRLQGRSVDRQLVHDEQLAAAVTLSTPLLLRRVREAYDGPLVVMKGPVLAELYPEPRLRPFGDVDVLVADAERTQRALLAAGFRPVGDPSLFRNIHHLRPLIAPGLALTVEVHDRPKWPEGCQAPPVEELLARAIPAPDGLLRLPAAEHALLVAAHSWAHAPLGRLGQLLDAHLLAAGADEAELRALTRCWSLERLWNTTALAAEALFGDGASSWPLRTWARSLPAARERTVFERHLETWLAPFSALSFPRSAAAAARGALGTVRRQPEEAWREKLARTSRALRSPRAPLSKHRQALAGRSRKAS
jgi:hypothetical protein